MSIILSKTIKQTLLGSVWYNNPEDIFEEPTLAIPNDFCSDESNDMLLIYGSIPADYSSNKTVISFNINDNSALFIVEIYPDAKFIKRYASLYIKIKRKQIM